MTLLVVLAAWTALSTAAGLALGAAINHNRKENRS